MKRYKVKEIFGPTIEGEGSKAGEVVLFLRLSGCNRWSGREEDRADSVCHFCDTDFLGGELLEREAIVDRLLDIGSRYYKDGHGNEVHPRMFQLRVVISGGEPTLQMDYFLLRALKENNFLIYVETNGSRRIDPKTLDLIDHLVVSPKQSEALTKIKVCDDLKLLYPYLEGADMKAFQKLSAGNRFIQPIKDSGSYQDYKRNLDGAINECIKNPEYKLSIQLHKIIQVQ